MSWLSPAKRLWALAALAAFALLAAPACSQLACLEDGPEEACHTAPRGEEYVEQQEDALSNAMEMRLLQHGATVMKAGAQAKRLFALLTPDVDEKQDAIADAAVAVVAARAADDQETARDAQAAEATVAGWRGSAKGPGGGVPAAVNEPQVAVDTGSGKAARAAGTPSEAVRPAAGGRFHSLSSQELAQVAVPVAAFVLGGALWAAGQSTVGMLAIYFGAQTGFSLYMKVVLSNASISEEMHLKGIPAGFLVTAIQQFVAFLVLAVAITVLWMTRWRYMPRRLGSLQELATMLLFSLAFAVNIGLNNMSLSLLAVSLNLIIRSCMPLVCLLVQSLYAGCMPGSISTKVAFTEVALMVAGVVFAGVATLAKGEGAHGASESSHLVLGVLVCVLSDFAAALNMVLASAFKTHLDPPLNPVDTIWYMALPCGLFLLPPSFSYQHPVDWPGFERITDWEVIKMVVTLSPSTLSLIVFSGIFAAAYNILQYTLVQQLSPTHAAFAGNFNKAATIMLSIVLGLESLPSSVWGPTMVLAIVGNIVAFTAYSWLKVGSGGKGHGHFAHGGKEGLQGAGVPAQDSAASNA